MTSLIDTLLHDIENDTELSDERRELLRARFSHLPDDLGAR
jgi:hypothetical protein